jgi:hypothetical protein
MPRPSALTKIHIKRDGIAGFIPHIDIPDINILYNTAAAAGGFKTQSNGQVRTFNNHKIKLITKFILISPTTPPIYFRIS